MHQTDPTIDLSALPDPFRGWLTARQASERLGLNMRYVQQLAADGKLVSLRTPLGRLIREVSVEEYRRTHAERRDWRGCRSSQTE